MKSKLFIILVVVYLSASCADQVCKGSSAESYSSDNREGLIEMAKERFEDFDEADEILFSAVEDGEWADYREGGGKDRVEDSNKWGVKRLIKANRIEWLCFNKGAREIVTDKGIRVTGAKIEGKVDLECAKISFPLIFYGCVFEEEIDLKHSEIEHLSLTGSHTKAIIADGIDVKGDVFLREGFDANGVVSFIGAKIGGDFDCSKGEFTNKKGKVAIEAGGIDVEGNVFLDDDFKANGNVSFRGAKIGGDFDCSEGEFNNRGNDAISAGKIDVKGTVFLHRGFKADGGVNFVGAKIGGDFDCEKGKFKNEGDVAISADKIDVKGSVFLRYGFEASGKVRFASAKIGGTFDCTKGEFNNEGDAAIFADRIDVRSSVFLDSGFKAEGEVSFQGAVVGGKLTWKDVNQPEKSILDLRNAKAMVLADDANSWPKRGNLFLDGFVYERIDDDSPKKAEPKKADSNKGRIEWLNRQKQDRFRPGPYEQLAMVLDKMGHSEDAKKILIEKERKRTELGGFGRWKKYRRGILGVTIGYGYQPWRALWFIGTLVLVGVIVFGTGYIGGLIIPAEKDAYTSMQDRELRAGYPRFTLLAALVYSIDVFVPVIDLHMAKYWRPDTNKLLGNFIRLYMWCHICAGWIFTTLLIVGLTGLVKK